MILYFSKDRIENLHTEQTLIRPKLLTRILSILKRIKVKKIGVEISKVSISTEFDAETNRNKTKDVLSYLMSQRQISDVKNTDYFQKMQYFYCEGELCTDEETSANLADEFKGDDVLGFYVNINNDIFNKVHIKCSVHNLSGLSHFRGADNEVHYYIGSGPNFLFKRTKIEMIFLVDDIDVYSKTISGSPIIISSDYEKWLYLYVNNH